MSATVTVPAPDHMMTTVSAVLAHDAIPSDTDAAEIERLIKAASRAAEKFSGRVFARQTYEEKIDGSNSREMLVKHTPIVGTPTIVCDSSPVIDFEVSDATAGILYREVGWAATGISMWYSERDFVTPVGGRRYTVTYEAGYLLPGQKDSDLPDDYEQAVIETVVFWLVRNPDPNVKSHKVDDLAITYGEGIGGTYDGIPPIARSLLPARLTA